MEMYEMKCNVFVFLMWLKLKLILFTFVLELLNKNERKKPFFSSFNFFESDSIDSLHDATQIVTIVKQLKICFHLIFSSNSLQKKRLLVVFISFIDSNKICFSSFGFINNFHEFIIGVHGFGVSPHVLS